MSDSKKRYILSYRPHEKQKIIHADTHRFKIVCAGRRSGKSLCVMGELLNRCLSPRYNYNKYSTIGWIAPTYQICNRGVDALKLITKHCPQLIKINSSPPLTANLINNIQIKFLSADNPDSLRGFGFNFLIIDEAAYIPDYLWYSVIRPALSDKMGNMIAISTPRAKGNWFHNLYLQGLNNGENKEFEEGNSYKSFHFPTSANPYIKKTEIEEARRSLPVDIFRREYLAEFVDSGGEVFSNLKNMYDELGCNCNAPEILGIDLAKHMDYTVIIKICSVCHRIKKIYRWNTINWDQQQDLIKNVYISSISPVIYIDATGVGDVVYDGLVSEGFNVIPIKFTNTKKQALINNLRLRIMECDIKINKNMENAELLKHELECYEIQTTKTGLTTYNAISGMHDDIVIALALAAEGIKNYITASTNYEKEAKGEEELWEPVNYSNGYNFEDDKNWL